MAKFSQPAFRKATKDDKKTPSATVAENNNKPRHFHQTGSRILDLHQQRVRTAGRVGTKRFVNPCLVFIGNLPYNTTNEELQTWLCDQMATPQPFLLHQNKVDVIRDWKTGQSKGYAFVTFAAAHLATLAIEQLHHCNYQGRLLTVSQGQKKPDPNLILLQEQKKQRKLERRSLEQEATETALEILEPEEYALLARLDPDLLVNTEVEDDSLEDNDDDYDGDFIEYEDDDDDDDLDSKGDEEAGRMNRQQRREAAKGKKKRKLPHKGFG
ncbi:hypothetical protein FisN_10Hh364 [Fistulifera solaris]|uniref:RRM domain-containing protein n=1 Tax=Fistulifera solaris TaxID=1519565 RepID=A0A1Z5JRC6_FISSO|nr:hypothetical protein FisN_10Hh364 [Fistulifera solaris]|eukprot:GAX16402.1 hypothetical protein FisN_10Hh364 [Fistulifera solaris]